MATSEKWTQAASAITLMSASLNSLASSSGLTAGAISTSAFVNTQGNAGDGYVGGKLILSIAAPASTLTSGVVYVWTVESWDGGTTYETGSASQMPGKAPIAIFNLPLLSTAQAQVQRISRLPFGTMKFILSQATGVVWNASGNTLLLLPETPQGV